MVDDARGADQKVQGKDPVVTPAVIVRATRVDQQLQPVNELRMSR